MPRFARIMILTLIVLSGQSALAAERNFFCWIPEAPNYYASLTLKKTTADFNFAVVQSNGLWSNIPPKDVSICQGTGTLERGDELETIRATQITGSDWNPRCEIGWFKSITLQSSIELLKDNESLKDAITLVWKGGLSPVRYTCRSGVEWFGR